jgi:hypothetical protein
MTINGDFTLLPGGVLELEVVFDEAVGVPRIDRIQVSGSVRLAGHVDFIVGPDIDLDRLNNHWFFDGTGFFACGPGFFNPCSITYDPTFTYDFPGRPGSQIAFANGSAPKIVVLADIAPVPEPSVFATMLAGLGVLGGAAMRRRRAASRRAQMA